MLTILGETGMGPVEWLLNTLVGLLFWVVLINVVLSWLISFNVVNRDNRLVNTIWDATERLTRPLLDPIRRLIPPLGGMDLSPVVLIIALQFSQIFLIPQIPF
jgi:YggT family protein